jgi:hypothetical protein
MEVFDGEKVLEPEIEEFLASLYLGSFVQEPNV